MKGHIRKRGARSWAIKLDVGRDPITGKRRTKWHTVHGTKRDAERECNRLLHELETGGYVEPTRLTVAEFLSRWLDDVRPNLRPKTFERYDQIVRHHLIPALGHHPLLKLQPLHVSAAWSKGLAQGRRDGTGGLSAQTVKHHHRILSQALKRAVRWRLVARNPAEDVDPPRPQRKEIAILSREETATLLKAINHTRLYIPVLLAVTTGMRRGEVLGLRWRDVDLEDGALSVAQVLEQTSDGLSFQPPKTARSRRLITLPALTVNALRSHKARQAQERLKLGLGRDDDGLVVCRSDGQPVQPRSLTHEFTRQVKRAGGRRVRFHDLRHTHISHLLQNGVHPKVASERAGHASVSITLDVYSHVMPGMQEEAASRIDEFLGTVLEH